MQNDRRDQKELEKRKLENISQVHFNGHDREYN